MLCISANENDRDSIITTIMETFLTVKIVKI
jgi:hypothetical protein